MIESWLTQLGVPPDVVAVMELGLLGRLVLAAVLGGLIGLEREVSGKPAGLRTNLLICVGATLLTEISIQTAMMANVANETAGVIFRADPGRIAAQIVSGIGFLGAGTILQARGNVIGLTTAATIWVVASIGMAVGARAYVQAVGSTALVFVALVLLARLEVAILRRRRVRRYLVVFDDATLIEGLEAVFEGFGLGIDTFAVEKREGRFEVSVSAGGAAAQHDRLVQSLITRPGVERLTHWG